MKKTILLILLLVSMAVCSSARGKGGNPYYKTGYRGSIGMHLGGINSYLGEIGFTTIHGKTFGNGVFLGGGIGFSYPVLDWETCLTVPIFIDAKYSVLNQRVSPFVEAKIGTMFFYGSDVGMFLSPVLGVDIGRWSIFVSYELRQNYEIKDNCMLVGFSWNF